MRTQEMRRIFARASHSIWLGFFFFVRLFCFSFFWFHPLPESLFVIFPLFLLVLFFDFSFFFFLFVSFFLCFGSQKKTKQNKTNKREGSRTCVFPGRFEDSRFLGFFMVPPFLSIFGAGRRDALGQSRYTPTLSKLLFHGNFSDDTKSSCY